jgi:undecaprenyl-diphosphatase
MIWEEAVSYSLLISIPAIVGGATVEALGVLNRGSLLPELPGMYVGLGLLLSAIIALLALLLLRGRAGRRSLVFFSLWCWVVGIAAVLATTVLG